MSDQISPGSQMQGIRNRLADGALIVVSWIAVPALAFSLWRMHAIGWQPVMGLHIAAALVIWSVSFGRARIAFVWRAAAIIGLFLLIGLGGFMNLSLSGAGYPFLILATVLATALLGLRGGLFVLAFGCLAIVTIGWGFVTGAMELRFDLNAYNTQTSSWSMVLFGFLLLGGGAISVVSGLSNALLKSIEALHQRGRRLEVEISERTDQLARETLERQNAEASLGDSERRYHMIVDMQSEVITRFDPDGILTFVNRAYCEFVDKTEDALIGTSIYDDVPEDDAARIKTYFESFTIDEPFRRNENQLRRFDGVLRDFEWSNFAQFNDAGEIIRFQSVGRDVTEKKRIEAALIESEARYQLVVDSQGELITRFLPDGRFTFVNGAYCRFVGRDEKEVLGGSIFDDVPAGDRDRLAAYLATFSESQPIQYIENELTRHDGVNRVLQWQDTAHFDDDGAITEYQSVARDVTEERRAQEALKVATVEAQAANVAKSDFLATMSHEIRTPVAGILGLADILIDEGLTPEQRQTVSRIKGAGMSLVTILNDILDLSKIQAGKLEIESVDFDLGQLIADSLDIFYPKASDKGVALGSKLDEKLPGMIVSDPNRIRQILVNLIGNAVKFTEQGSVTLAVSVAEERHDQVVLRFDVRDTGIGIAEDRQELLFQDFTQADPSTARKYEGTGLGLAISKRLTELLGGEIGVESTVGDGATFWFSVPVKRSDESSIAPAKKFDDRIFKGQRQLNVLLAEDNDLNQMIIKAVLAKFDHVVTAVDNGREAVEAVRKGDFDLVLMDVRMPELDGPDATRMIRQEGSDISGIPIIAVTADAIAENLDSYLKAGMNACVTKPIDQAELLLAINDVLNEDVHVAVDEDGDGDGDEDGGA